MEKTALKDIVVTIDFSEESMNGLRFALVFIKKIKANISLVYVLNRKNKYQEKDGKDEYNWAKEQLENIILKYQVRLKYGKFSYNIFKGTIHKEVIKYAKSINAYLIITSSHGISGFKELLIGSNANKIATYSKCPVITVKDDSCARNISKILLPIDRTINSRQKVPIAAEIAKKHNAEVHVMLLDSLDTIESKNQLDSFSFQVCKYLNDSGVKFIQSYHAGSDFTKMILDYANSISTNLIIIMSEQELRAKNLFLGTFAQQIVNTSTIPVLCVHPKSLYIMPGLHAMPA